jgi:nucleotide-binding universal stress UspA family protein
MPVKTILLPLSDTDAPGPVLETALGLAQRFEAHLDLLFVLRNPRHLLPYVTLGLSKHMRDSVLRSTEHDAHTAVEQAQQLFRRSCFDAGIPIVETRTVDSGASAAWHGVIGHEDELLAVRGRLSDLIVLPGPVEVSPTTAVAEAALKATGRPVLIAPQQAEPIVGTRVGIGWNGTAEAARAVGAAMAYLHGAEAVTIFAGGHAERMNPAPQDLVAYLGWHGVDAEVQTIEAHDPHVGEALLAACAARGINLLVVGAYSRSRWREFILGGVTEHLLKSAEVPVFMVH